MSESLQPVQLHRGDVLLAKGPTPYTVADLPETEPMYFINPGQACTDASGRNISAEMKLDTRAWGNDPDGSTILVTGTYECASAVSERLLRSLPQLVVLSSDQWNSTLATLLCDEVQRDELGQEVFLDRLLDLVLMAAVRGWLAIDKTNRPGLFVANSDPIVGPALRLLHEHVNRPWTVATLATEVGSRERRSHDASPNCWGNHRWLT
jgi:hypothetical protein